MAAILIILLIVLIYFALVMPRTTERPDMSFMLMRKYAHRGFHGEGAPENTLAAFSRAIDAGYGIELDVQLTADGVPVVFHDYTLKRMLGDDKKIAELTFDELHKYTFEGTEEKIPTFAEVLELVGGSTPLIIELKGESTDTSLCPVVADLLDSYSGVFAVQSFNPLLMRYMKIHRPQFIRGQLATGKYDNKNFFFGFILSNMMLNFLSRPDYAAYHHRSYTLTLDIFKLFSVPRFAWTLRNPEDEEKAKKRFETVIFENYEA